MKKASLIIIAALSISACEEREELVDKHKAYFEREVNTDVIYARDERTGLCFAKPWGSFRMFTFVPCTKRVFQEIEKGKLSAPVGRRIVEFDFSLP